jgi:hypothetical protein
MALSANGTVESLTAAELLMKERASIEQYAVRFACNNIVVVSFKIV